MKQLLTILVFGRRGYPLEKEEKQQKSGRHPVRKPAMESLNDYDRQVREHVRARFPRLRLHGYP